jgi:hypothetical protein
VLFWDHNLEIRIDFQGLGQSGPRHEVGLGTGPVQSAPPLPPQMPGTSDPLCPASPCGLSPFPPMYMYLCAFIFPLIPFRGSCSCCCVWLVALDACQALSVIALAMAGIVTAPRASHPCALMCLFVFPPSLVGRT